jgi:hypothetical protein
VLCRGLVLVDLVERDAHGSPVRGAVRIQPKSFLEVREGLAPPAEP